MEPTEAQLRRLYRLIQCERLEARYLVFIEENTIASSEAGTISANFGRILDIFDIRVLKEYIIYRDGHYLDTDEV